MKIPSREVPVITGNVFPGYVGLTSLPDPTRSVVAGIPGNNGRLHHNRLLLRIESGRGLCDSIYSGVIYIMREGCILGPHR